MAFTELNHTGIPNGVIWTTPAIYVPYRYYMEDETGRGGAMRPCYQTVERNEFFAPFANHRFYRGWCSNAYAAGVTDGKVAGTLALRQPPAFDWSYLAEQALAFMMLSVNSGTSLINSIYELKDLKLLNPLPSLKRIVNRGPSVSILNNKVQRKRFKKEVITRLNNAALGASFGIVPFVQDVVNIYDELMGMAARLSRLKQNAERLLQARYRRVLPDDSGGRATGAWKYATSDNSISWPSGLRTDSLDNGGNRRDITLVRRCRWVTRPVYHATLRYTYRWPQLGNTMEKVLFALETLGVRFDPSIIWNAIPFSFLVDWVVDVGGFLSSFARETFPIEIQIRQFYHSIKWAREAEIDASYITDTALAGSAKWSHLPQNPSGLPVYRGYSRYYKRTGATPSVGSVRLNTPTLKQAALSGSLLLARTSWGRMTGYRYTPR